MVTAPEHTPAITVDAEVVMASFVAPPLVIVWLCDTVSAPAVAVTLTDPELLALK